MLDVGDVGRVLLHPRIPSRVSAARATVASKFANAAASSSRVKTLHVTPELEHVLPMFVEARFSGHAQDFSVAERRCIGTSSVPNTAIMMHIRPTASGSEPERNSTVTVSVVSRTVACTP